MTLIIASEVQNRHATKDPKDSFGKLGPRAFKIFARKNFNFDDDRALTMASTISINRTMAATRLSALLAILVILPISIAFQPLANHRPLRVSPPRHASVSADANDATIAAASMKQSLNDLIAGTDRGRSTSPQQQIEIEDALQQLESTCTLEAPANSPLVEGEWIVEYTDASAPSNGQLGPFSGIARQVVSLDNGTYRNLLSVPPNDWLTACLDATWQKWDGQYLDDQSPSRDATPNIGGSCWLVTFETLTIKLFGIPIVTNNFDNVQRVWRTTYVDDTTRVVKAGRTGRQDDEMTFYMTRE